MPVQDWLSDPLMVLDSTKSWLTYRSPNIGDMKAWIWKSSHFATRLKLEGSVHFCRQLLGAASLTINLGLPLLAHRQREWYAAAFFFELCSAYDTLLQELNIIYDCRLDKKEVIWGAIKPKLPGTVAKIMKRERDTDWFKKVHWYRNTATHHALIPMGESAGGWGEQTWDMEVDRVMIFYIDEQTNDVREEDITISKEYLSKMLEHIQDVWGKMGQRFK